jgi:hypothetical protein
MSDFNRKMLDTAIELKLTYPSEEEHLKRVCTLINSKAEIPKFIEKVKRGWRPER